MVFGMTKYTVLTVIGYMVIFYEKAESLQIQTFCESGEPNIINETASGRGEIKIDSILFAKSWLVHVNEEDNFGIEIRLTSFLLEDFYLVIEDDKSLYTNYTYNQTDFMIQLISGRSVKPLLFRIPFAKSFYMEVCPENTILQRSLQGNLHLNFERTEPVLDDDLPEEDPIYQMDKESFEVQFKGQPPVKFHDARFLEKFKESVKNLARYYCEVSNIDFDDEKPAAEMVTVFAIRECPAEWHDRHLCASVKHSVFVTKVHVAPAAIWNYQLRREHLWRMWQIANDSYFLELGLSIYQFPNKEEVLGWWFLLIVLPSLSLIILMISIKKISSYIMKGKQMKLIESPESLVADTRRKSKLRPNMYQNVPAFIRNQSRSNSRKHGNLESNDEQYPEQQSYYAARLFPNLAHRLLAYNNDAYVNEPK